MKPDPTSLPKYVQTSEMLIREIAAGRLLDGERLPPERQMANNLGIAVGTLRKALSELESRGLLERIHGSGNYIRQVSSASGVYAFFRLELIKGGGLPTAQVIDVARTVKPPDLPALGHSKDAHRIRRRRLLSGTPVALEEIWLDGAWADHLRPETMSESLYLFYRQSLGLWIGRAEDHVGLDRVPEWAGAHFSLASGAMAGHVERQAWASDGDIAEYSRTWFDSDKCRYVSRMR
jgi:GntR family transcriptional regulator